MHRQQTKLQELMMPGGWISDQVFAKAAGQGAKSSEKRSAVSTPGREAKLSLLHGRKYMGAKRRGICSTKPVDFSPLK